MKTAWDLTQELCSLGLGTGALNAGEYKDAEVRYEEIKKILQSIHFEADSNGYESAARFRDKLEAAESKIKKLEAERKVIVKLDKKRKQRHPKYYFMGTRAEADEHIGNLTDKIKAMRHDLVVSEGLWCTDIEDNAPVHGFQLKHKSLET